MEGMVSHSIHERYRKTLDELGKDKSIVVSYQGLMDSLEEAIL